MCRRFDPGSAHFRVLKLNVAESRPLLAGLPRRQFSATARGDGRQRGDQLARLYGLGDVEQEPG
jgi:hypothetical protein